MNHPLRIPRQYRYAQKNIIPLTEREVYEAAQKQSILFAIYDGPGGVEAVGGVKLHLLDNTIPVLQDSDTTVHFSGDILPFLSLNPISDKPLCIPYTFYLPEKRSNEQAVDVMMKSPLGRRNLRKQGLFEE